MKWKSEFWKITKSEIEDLKNNSNNLLIILTKIIFIGICVLLDIILSPFYFLASIKRDNYNENYKNNNDDEYY